MQPVATGRVRRRAVRPTAIIVVAVLVLVASGAVVGLLLTRGEREGVRDDSLAVAREAYAEARFADAEAAAQAVLARDATAIDARRLLAMSLAAQGKNEAAIDAFGAVVEAYPSDHESYYRMAVLERLIGRIDAAIEHFERALGIKEDPVYADELARTYAQVGRYADAIARWRVVLESTTLNEAQRAQTYAAMASAYEGLRDYERAREMLRKAVELAPNDESLKTRLEAIEDDG